jgi:hypothetical protein
MQQSRRRSPARRRPPLGSGRETRGTAGAEREHLFRMMAGLFPPHTDYQAKTAREIPVVVLEPQAEIARL